MKYDTNWMCAVLLCICIYICIYDFVSLTGDFRGNPVVQLSDCIQPRVAVVIENFVQMQLLVNILFVFARMLTTVSIVQQGIREEKSINWNEQNSNFVSKHFICCHLLLALL